MKASLKALACIGLASVTFNGAQSLAQAQGPSIKFPTSLAARSLGACDRTTAAAASSCSAQASGDYSLALGACENEALASDKQRCRSEATKAFNDATDLCRQQTQARDNVCDTIGQQPYDPAIVPSDFSTSITNPLLPLKPGSVWVYRNGLSQVTVTVLSQTRVLAGVTTLTVHDVNTVAGVVEEDTYDYYAQRKDGSVWYFGEDTIAYDDGTADTTGSWRAGVDGAKPGIIMFARPVLDRTYRQEFRLGTAEDMAKSLAVNQHVVVPYGTFDTAFKTREFTAIEPGGVEFKFYVPHVGNVLTVNPDTGEREELVSYTPGP